MTFWKILADDLGNRRLAVARWSVDQNGVSGIDRRTQPVHEPLGHDQALKCLVQTLAGDDFVADPLAQDAVLVVLERTPAPARSTARASKRRPPIRDPRGSGSGAFRARVDTAGAGGQHLDEFAFLGSLHELVHDRARKLQGARPIATPFRCFRSTFPSWPDSSRNTGSMPVPATCHRHLRRIGQHLIDLLPWSAVPSATILSPSRPPFAF